VSGDPQLFQGSITDHLRVHLHLGLAISKIFLATIGDLIGLIAGKIEFATDALVGFDHDADLDRIEYRVLKQTIDCHDAPRARLVRRLVGPLR